VCTTVAADASTLMRHPEGSTEAELGRCAQTIGLRTSQNGAPQAVQRNSSLITPWMARTWLNLTASKALGLTFPQSLLQPADQVIE
jgi:hypothetical protein